MVSTFTPNINLENPARGDDTGTWDTPVVNNMTVLDLILGGSVTIPLTNAPVILNAGQYQCAQIILTGALAGNVVITFPAAFKKPYTIQNQCTGAFQIQLAAAGGGQVVACPPGQVFDIVNDGTNIKYKNFGPHIGGYWDYAGSAVPAWIGFCSVPPYLNCNGGTFSAATYPALNAIIGTNVLPDFRGRMRVYLNQGTGTTTVGPNADFLFNPGGAQVVTLANANIPMVTVNEGSGHSHPAPNAGGGGQFMIRNSGADTLSVAGGPNAGTITNTGLATTGLTVGNSSPTSFAILPPATVGGLTLIRAA